MLSIVTRVGHNREEIIGKENIPLLGHNSHTHATPNLLTQMLLNGSKEGVQGDSKKLHYLVINKIRNKDPTHHIIPAHSDSTRWTKRRYTKVVARSYTTW